MDMRELHKKDPLKRAAEKSTDAEGLSPMDPPDAYVPPSKVAVPYAELHPFLQRLVDEHEALVAQLTIFEQALLEIQSSGLTPEHGRTLQGFFEFFEREVPHHDRREERHLFPLLRRRLIEHGEHGTTPERTTGVDVLENDHVRATRQAAVSCSLLGLAVRLPDAETGMMVLAMGVKQGMDLIEHLRLHIFREENIIFGLAQRYLSTAELDAFAND